MSRILVYTSPGRGHLFPVTPILDELQRRGHEISLRTLASQVPLMRDRGFNAAPITPDVEAIEHDDWGARNSRESLARTVRVLTAGSAQTLSRKCALPSVGPPSRAEASAL